MRSPLSGGENHPQSCGYLDPRINITPHFLLLSHPHTSPELGAVFSKPPLLPALPQQFSIPGCVFFLAHLIFNSPVSWWKGAPCSLQALTPSLLTSRHLQFFTSCSRLAWGRRRRRCCHRDSSLEQYLCSPVSCACPNPAPQSLGLSLPSTAYPAQKCFPALLQQPQHRV